MKNPTIARRILGLKFLSLAGTHTIKATNRNPSASDMNITYFEGMSNFRYKLN